MLARAAALHHRAASVSSCASARRLRSPATRTSIAPRDRVEAVHARAALTGVLIGEPACRARDLGQRAHPVARHRDHDPRAQTAAGPAQRRRRPGERRPQRVGRHPGAEVPADEHRREVGAVGTGQLQHVAEPRRRAGSRTPRAAPTAPESVTSVVPGSSRVPADAEPVGAEAADQREVAERLDVLHERRPAVDAAFERPGRHERRLRVAAVQPVDERGLLAGHVAVRSADHADRAPRRSRTARRSAIARSSTGCTDRAALDAQDHLARADDLGREHGAVEHEVRRVAHQHDVLEARRLALGAVRDHDRPPARRDRGELRRGREPRAALAAQPAALDLGEQRRAGLGQLAVPLDVLVERALRAAAAAGARRRGAFAAGRRLDGRSVSAVIGTSRLRPRPIRSPRRRRRREAASRG